MTSVTRIERRLANQAMHAGLRAQPAVGVLTHDMDRRTLDAGNLAGRRLHEFCFEAVRLGPPQVHAQDHLGPVLGLGTTGARLDVYIGIVGVQLSREHASKLEAGHPGFEARQVADDFTDRVVVFFFNGEFEQFGRVAQAAGKFVKGYDDLLQLRALLPQGLRALRFVPDIGLLELPLDLGQALGLALVVKDTPSTHWSVR